MKAEYLLAISIVALFVSAAFFAMAQIETASVSRLRASLEDYSIESDSTRLTVLLAESFDKQEQYCEAMNNRISTQLSKNFSVLSQIKNTEGEIFLTEITQLKKKYFLSNVQLYYYLKQSREQCNPEDVLLIYFYIDKDPCPECDVQGRLLDSLRGKCSNLKVFSFPIDIDLETTNFLKSFFSIESAPSIVIDEKFVLKGLQSEEQLLNYFGCKQA
jgi:hypothetical protein